MDYLEKRLLVFLVILITGSLVLNSSVIFLTLVFILISLSWKGARQYYCPPVVEMITVTLNAEQFSSKAK